jgi:predicted metal-dependent phosphotriesterase family hydrolase
VSEITSSRSFTAAESTAIAVVSTATESTATAVVSATTSAGASAFYKIQQLKQQQLNLKILFHLNLI